MRTFKIRALFALLASFISPLVWATDTTNTTHDVVIVGAGSAGLYAAKTLIADGYDVLIIEATDRIGGRVYSETLGQTRIELGAEEHYLATGNNPVWPALQGNKSLFAVTETSQNIALMGQLLQALPALIFRISIQTDATTSLSVIRFSASTNKRTTSSNGVRVLGRELDDCLSRDQKGKLEIAMTRCMFGPIWLRGERMGQISGLLSEWPQYATPGWYFESATNA